MMNKSSTSSQFALIVVNRGGSTSADYSLEEAARIVRVHPERLRFYCRRGFFGAALARPDTDPIFDDDRLYELRRFEHLRQNHRASQQTLRLLGELWREVERLKAELGYWREK
jgi:DNA-binding transcriptional MerR regulator